MKTIKQIVAVTWLNLRNIPQRLASSAVAVVGVGAVVLVFAAVLDGDGPGENHGLGRD